MHGGSHGLGRPGLRARLVSVSLVSLVRRRGGARPVRNGVGARADLEDLVARGVEVCLRERDLVVLEVVHDVRAAQERVA